MLGLFVRVLLIVGGGIASWFVSNDALNYEVVQFVAALLIFVLMAVLAAFGPVIWDRIRAGYKRINPD